MLADLGSCREFSRNRGKSGMVVVFSCCVLNLFRSCPCHCKLLEFTLAVSPGYICFALPIWIVKLQDPVPHLLLVLLLHAVMLGCQNMKDCDTE